ncbi:NAD-dependent epimerase/dehydratase family protein [Halobacterium wangiae]|uniref:NAD-dependent epimerase/dehydratase family protein n=1 Tax=Halobacterium wangiae TaxID=2902623 RepID=UPI001E5DC723|nr:NAD-dependent epimerase/dehydratase family protein [Halobacterium wangiae]
MSDTVTVGVTGAGGYLGSHVTRTLLDAGHDVVPVDDFSNGDVQSVGGREVADVDVRDRDALSRVFEGVDAVVHLAAVSDVETCEQRPGAAFDVNVGGTENVAWLCRERGVPLSFAGSVAVFGEPETFPLAPGTRRDPLNLYGVTKQMSEDDIHSLATRSFPAHVFLMANLFGAHETDGDLVRKRTVIDIFVDAARNREPLTVYDPGTQARNFVHVADVADAYRLSVEALVGDDPGATTYTLGTGEVLSVLKIAELVQNAAEAELGYRPEIERVENPRDEAIAEQFSMETGPITEDLGFESSRSVEDTVRRLMRA